MSIAALLLNLYCLLGISCPDYVSPVVIIESDLGHGSGVFVSPTVVLTVGHVIDGVIKGKNVQVRLSNGETFKIDMSAIDPDMDLGIVTVDHPFKGKTPPINCSHMPRGEELVNVGNPRDMEFIQQYLTVTGGTEGNMDDGMGKGTVLYQGISIPGLSGSPVYTIDGQVVGLIDLMFADDDGRLGLGAYSSLEQGCQFVKQYLPVAA